MRRNPRRRGVILAGVVLLMAIVLGLLSVLMLASGQISRQRKTDQLRALARALVDSGAGYARARFNPTPATLPAEAVNLEVAPLLPNNVRGSLTLSFSSGVGNPTCRVEARTESGTLEAQDSLVIDLSREGVSGNR